MAVLEFIEVGVIGRAVLAASAAAPEEDVVLELGELGQGECNGLVEARSNVEAGLWGG